MRVWLRRHRVAAALVWAALTLAAAEAILLAYYLDSWLTLPLL
jgi:hypothetical protein